MGTGMGGQVEPRAAYTAWIRMNKHKTFDCLIAYGMSAHMYVRFSVTLCLSSAIIA